VLADGFSEENFAAWWDRLGGDCVAIERAVNHLHVGDLVPSDTTELDASVTKFLGATLIEMWAARVQALFPERRFVVRLEYTNDDNASSPTVLLYQRL